MSAFVSASASTSTLSQWFTQRMGLGPILCVCVCITINSNVKVDTDADAHVTCKQSFRLNSSIFMGFAKERVGGGTKLYFAYPFPSDGSHLLCKFWNTTVKSS